MFTIIEANELEAIYEAEECKHPALRWPNALSPTPGAIVVCPDCQSSWRRPAWMDRFTRPELRAFQIAGEIMAIWIDCYDPNSPTPLTHKEATQHVLGLTRLYQITGVSLERICAQFQEYA